MSFDVTGEANVLSKIYYSNTIISRVLNLYVLLANRMGYYIFLSKFKMYMSFVKIIT